MKTKLLIGCLMATSFMSNAQNTSPWPVSGNIGINHGSTGSPSFYKLDIHTGTNNDGIRIIEKSTANGGGGVGACGLYLDNQTTGGRNWSLLSLGLYDTPGAGRFTIFDNTSLKRRLLIDATGNVGIGSDYPTATKLDVVNDAQPSNIGFDQFGTKSSITQMSSIGAGPHWPFVGVQGKANTNIADESIMIGVRGLGSNGMQNYGGEFTATGGGCNTQGSYGVRATATGNAYSYGLYASASGGCNYNYGIYSEASGANPLAGYFNGSVYATGNISWSSDRKLKNDIKPLKNAMEKLLLLKPSTYLFKTDEFSTMGLPTGQQIGLIAQELEEVFPELIVNIPERSTEKNGIKTVLTPEIKSVQYVSLIPVLISGIQEQHAVIERESTLNKQLQGKVEELQKQLVILQDQMNALSQRPSGTTDLNQNLSAGSGFAMEQNEPNPFTQQTVVNYTLPQSVAKAYLAVYDLSGKQITTLPIRELGNASITITSQNLSAGIYIYSIMADGKVVTTKRMVVAEQ
jgi:hypothetical protein